MATVGSLSYAEDDNRHYLGVKAVVMQKDGRSQYCCYVIECANEVLQTKKVSYFKKLEILAV